MHERILLLTIGAIFIANVVCENAKYNLEILKPGQLDCSSIEGKIDFYEISATNEREHICEQNSTETQRVAVKDKILKFSNLIKEDMDKSYICQNDKNMTLSFDSHPQFIPDGEFKPNISLLSSSFRLKFSYTVKGANCTWRLQKPGKNNTVEEIEILKSDDKYIVDNFNETEKGDIWKNELYVLRPDSEDSGLYVCTLTNKYGLTYRMVDVKVKSDLLALVPFLIILAQVLLCSVLFFIWEKRCAGRESSNEYSFEQNYKNRQNPVA